MAINFGVFYKMAEDEIVMPAIKTARKITDPIFQGIEELFFKKPRSEDIKHKSPAVDNYRP